jgi:hypothetical protein
MSQKSVVCYATRYYSVSERKGKVIKIMKECGASHYPQEQLPRIQQCKPRVGGTACAFQASNGQACITLVRKFLVHTRL